MKFGELLAKEIIKAGEPFSSLIDESVLKELDMVHDRNLQDEGVADEYAVGDM